MSALLLAAGALLGAAWALTGWGIYLAFSGPLLLAGLVNLVRSALWPTEETGRHRG